MRHVSLFAVVLLSFVPMAQAYPGAISWTDDFSTDPLVGGRFVVPPGHDPSRFTYDGSGHFLTVHYDSLKPTAWCTHKVDPASGRGICRTRDFEFEVTFRINSPLVADPDQFAQIGWGLVNSATTGGNRAGNDPPGAPYAFDSMAFDYFPNVSAMFGGPTLGGTAIHSDVGQGYFSAFEFAFGAESRIDEMIGDEAIPVDAVCTAKVAFSAAAQTLTTTVRQGVTPLLINFDGAGGFGGPDGDPTTIQTFFFADDPVNLDRFALTALQDSFNLGGSSVKGDVDIMQVTFFAPASDKADMNDDGNIDGGDIDPFIRTVLSGSPDPMLVQRADMNFDGSAQLTDVPRFVEALLCP